jgi:hypothetical protein
MRRGLAYIQARHTANEPGSGCVSARPDSGIETLTDGEVAGAVAAEWQDAFCNTPARQAVARIPIAADHTSQGWSAEASRPSLRRRASLGAERELRRIAWATPTDLAVV